MRYRAVAARAPSGQSRWTSYRFVVGLECEASMRLLSTVMDSRQHGLLLAGGGLDPGLVDWVPCCPTALQSLAFKRFFILILGKAADVGHDDLVFL